IQNNKVLYHVEVAGPIELLSLAEQKLIGGLLILLPLTVLLAGIPGILLVKLTLKPVDTMITTLEHTTAENLKLKVHIPDTKDELKRLGDTFNDMLERLDRSFSSQQSFIQAISNELKAPLAALKKECLDTLKKHHDPKEIEPLTKRALSEIATCSKVIESLETLARFDNNRIPLEIRKVNLVNLIDEILAAVKPQATEKDIATSSILINSIIIDGDEKRLKELFQSLLDNAVKYTRRKGTITVSAHNDKKNAVVTVRDTGIGIEENDLPYIFDRFYQTSRPHKAKTGFGLGLSTAKAIAQVHKGTITVESKPGEGSLFTVILPLSYPV
ncbi:MAG: ATP-binding protein, partial [Candidatus Omnitrophica bacterium]|nr:ATP-binding protein [Candidatus Omnitrophota bacterium]